MSLNIKPLLSESPIDPSSTSRNLLLHSSSSENISHHYQRTNMDRNSDELSNIHRRFSSSSQILSQTQTQNDSSYILVNVDSYSCSPPKGYMFALHVSALADLACTIIITTHIVLGFSGLPKDDDDDTDNPTISSRWTRLVICGFIRAFIILLSASKPQCIKRWNWVVGITCFFSTIYLIYETFYLIHAKPNSDILPIGRSILLIILGLLFSQVHWIVYLIVTTSEAKQELLFDFTSVDDNQDQEHQPTENETFAQTSSTRHYGAIENEPHITT